jgi:peptide-methionine (S)-S-oxide reductase
MRMIVLSLFISLASALAVTAETRVATFAGGCFWCVESDFESVEGVIEAVSGYTGGRTKDPTYKQVSKGNTGHYEAVQITYDDAIVSYDRLLHLFFRSIDPLDAGGQFCDRGQSYATAVFFDGPQEERLAKRAKADAGRVLKRRIATELLPAGEFYEAEDYHQDYYKGENRVLTRFGWIKQADAYKRYRKGCGRDARVARIWGDEAPFADHD